MVVVVVAKAVHLAPIGPADPSQVGQQRDFADAYAAQQCQRVTFAEQGQQGRRGNGQQQQPQQQPQPQPQTQIENVPPEQAAAQPASASSPQTVAAVQTKPPTAPCNWQATAVEIQPTSPRKPAEYVHLVAQQNVLVCIKDAEQRVATLEMQAGDARSIYGPAPFKVYSTQLSGMQIYFQGQAIKLPSEEVQLLQLTAAAR